MSRLTALLPLLALGLLTGGAVRLAGAGYDTGREVQLAAASLAVVAVLYFLAGRRRAT